MEFVAPYLMPARQVSVLLIELHLQPLIMVFIWQFILYKFLSIGHIFSNNVHIDSLQLRILHIFEIMYAQKRISLCILLLMPYASMLIVSSAYTFQRLLLFLWILSSKTSIHHHQQGMSVLDSDILMGYLNIFDNYIWKTMLYCSFNFHLWLLERMAFLSHMHFLFYNCLFIAIAYFSIGIFTFYDWFFMSWLYVEESICL